MSSTRSNKPEIHYITHLYLKVMLSNDQAILGVKCPKLQAQGHKWVGVCVLSSIYNMRLVCLSEKHTRCRHLTIEESTLWGRWQLHKCLSTTSVHPRSRITYHSPCPFSPWAQAPHLQLPPLPPSIHSPDQTASAAEVERLCAVLATARANIGRAVKF